MRFAIIGAAAAALSLAACATPQVALTVNSDPQGAILEVRDNGAQHVTPVTFWYDAEAVQQAQRADGCWRPGAFNVYWDSGAFLTPPEGLVELCGHAPWNITYERPEEEPGLEHDLWVAKMRMHERTIAALDQELARLDAQEGAAAAWSGAGEAIGCAIAGGCPAGRSSYSSSRSSLLNAATAPYPSPAYSPPSMTAGALASDPPHRTKSVTDPNFYAPNIGPARTISKSVTDPDYYAPAIGPQRPATRSPGDSNYFETGSRYLSSDEW